MLYKNKKNGKLYTYLNTCINATNSLDGQQMVLYTKDNLLFVREKSEFFNKFDLWIEE